MVYAKENMARERNPRVDNEREWGERDRERERERETAW
jgi:hypothetical protein